MILQMKVSDSVTIPYAQYAINDHQIVNVIPLPVELATAIEAEEGFETIHWGALSDLGLIMACQCRNSLEMDNWDFEKYPNPEIVILSRVD